ncbi:MAG: hypothetical protein WA874_16715 [Chryseosolibacter sp.]
MNPLRSLRKHFLTSIFLAALIIGCEEDSDPGGPDQTVISQGMELEQSTRMTDAFPKQTQVAGTPKILDSKDTLYLIAGTYTNVQVTVESGDVAGFHVQVKGSKDYFKVTSARAFVEYAPSTARGFAITVDENSSAGPITLLYSAYNADQKVSNIIERPVIIVGMPGEGSEFISAGQWSTVWEIMGTGPDSDTIKMGVGKIYEFTTPLDCVNEPDKTVTFIQESRVDYRHYTFGSDGTLALEVDDFHQTLDRPASESSCSLQHAVTDEIDLYDGIWSYHSETKRLITRIKLQGTANVDRREFRVSMQDDKLVLTGINSLVPVMHVLEAR